jgi:hypothetical protein
VNADSGFDQLLSIYPEPAADGVRKTDAGHRRSIRVITSGGLRLSAIGHIPWVHSRPRQPMAGQG